MYVVASPHCLSKKKIKFDECDFYGMTLRDIHMCGKLRFTVTSCESTGSELGGLVCHQKGVDTSVVAWDATELGP